MRWKQPEIPVWQSWLLHRSPVVYPLSFIVSILFALRGCLLRKGVVAEEETLLVSFLLFFVVFLFGALGSSLMNYCLKNLCFCHRVSIIFLALHVYNLPLKFSSELPAIKTHVQPQLRLTGRLMTPDIKSGLPSGLCWGRMTTYPMSFHKCEVGYYMLQINTVTGRKCSLTRKRFSDN